MTTSTLQRNKGFTLVEIMVAVSIFAIVMVISTGSILSVFDANRKSQSLRSVMDNLNLTLGSITRTVRFGKNYHCDISLGVLTSPRDCSGGADSMSVTASSGSRVIYRLNGSRIERSLNDGTSYYALTSSDVTITSLKFYVFGSTTYSNGDVQQPRVIIVVSGYSGIKATSKSTFTLETTVSQRAIDSI